MTAIRLVPADGPVTEPVTKIGGQPVWLAAPKWPVSKRRGVPMTFLAQFQVAEDPPKLAYLFMTEAPGYVPNTWKPSGGENACFCQPGRVPSFVRTEPRAEGPTIGTDQLVVPLEALPFDKLHSRVGGSPTWLQNEEPPRGAWQFLAQLDSTDVRANFGDGGVGYVYVNPDTGEGRFLWQEA